MSHIWIEVGNRRWAMCCNHFQRRVGMSWKDDAGMTGPWPAYDPTTEHCSALQQYELKIGSPANAQLTMRSKLSGTGVNGI
jgi:hypothetical protein